MCVGGGEKTSRGADKANGPSGQQLVNLGERYAGALRTQGRGRWRRIRGNKR